MTRQTYSRNFLLLIVFLGGLTQLLSAQKVDRVEPPNWWTGMQTTSLQLFVHGENLKGLTARTTYPGLQVNGTHEFANHRYLAIDLILADLLEPGNAGIELLNAEGKTVARFSYPIEARQPNSALREGHNATDVIYLLMPDRFANGDPGNDEISGMAEGPDRTDPFGRHGGDLAGIRKHLDYIRDMGFTAIWPNPVLENDMPKASYHGYAITDFYKVDARLGTNDEFRQLVRECSAKGIKMIKDMVLNHCGIQHWMVKNPPDSTWVNYFKQPFTQTNHGKTIQPDPYAVPEDESVLEDGWFVRTMADMNVRNPFLAAYLIQNTIWWIEWAGLSGIRMDTYPYPDDAFMANWEKAVMSEYPNFTITAEVWHDQPGVIAWWQSHREELKNSPYKPISLFDFPLQSTVSRDLNGHPWRKPWEQVYEILAMDFLYQAPEEMVVFADNHDMSRVYTQFNDNLAKTQNALALVLTTRGIPQIFYGTEILMRHPGTDSHGELRADFPGGWPGDQVNAFSGQGLDIKQADMQLWMKKLVNWRKGSLAVQKGRLYHYLPENGIYVYFRMHGSEKVMVILNANENETRLSLDRFSGHAPKGTSVINVITEEVFTLDTEITLTAPGPLILAFR